MLLSFLGSIGHLMEAFGIEEAIKQCYGSTVYGYIAPVPDLPRDTLPQLEVNLLSSVS